MRHASMNQDDQESQYGSHTTTAQMDHNGSPSVSVSVLGSRRPRVKKMWQNRYVKLLVIGDSGLGKTTLIRSLLAVPGEQVQLHDGSETLFSEFQKNPEQFLSSISWNDDDDCVKWVYQVCAVKSVLHYVSAILS